LTRGLRKDFRDSILVDLFERTLPLVSNNKGVTIIDAEPYIVNQLYQGKIETHVGHVRTSMETIKITVEPQSIANWNRGK
jgi:hypothetical protein